MPGNVPPTVWSGSASFSNAAQVISDDAFTIPPIVYGQSPLIVLSEVFRWDTDGSTLVSPSTFYFRMADGTRINLISRTLGIAWPWNPSGSAILAENWHIAHEARIPELALGGVIVRAQNQLAATTSTIHALVVAAILDIAMTPIVAGFGGPNSSVSTAMASLFTAGGHSTFFTEPYGYIATARYGLSVNSGIATSVSFESAPNSNGVWYDIIRANASNMQAGISMFIPDSPGSDGPNWDGEPPDVNNFSQSGGYMYVNVWKPDPALAKGRSYATIIG